MMYVDRTLTCVDCGVEFIHSAADQEFYAETGFASDPKRCASCRAYRRTTRDEAGGRAASGPGPAAGEGGRVAGGPRGYERPEDRGPREYFVAICSSCGNQAQVPFKPRMDKPVYCSDCFRTVRPD
jgi:CxxC-x17-CxxC domain-containing protein